MNVTRCTLLVASFAAYTVQARSAERPNFVWIVSEDNSKHYLRLFDPSGTPTPHIELTRSERAHVRPRVFEQPGLFRSTNDARDRCLRATPGDAVSS